MHDHSRFHRDIDDVTDVSFSLLLTKVTHAQYRKRFCASYNTPNLTLTLDEKLKHFHDVVASVRHIQSRE